MSGMYEIITTCLCKTVMFSVVFVCLSVCVSCDYEYIDFESINFIEDMQTAYMSLFYLIVLVCQGDGVIVTEKICAVLLKSRYHLFNILLMMLD